MNKALVWVAILCFVMGGTMLVLAWKRMQPVATRPDSLSVVDTSYRRKPADASQPWLKDYTLVDGNGHDFHSQELAGKVHVVSFFYSTCPGICLRMNTKKSEIAHEFGPKGVKFVSISVDPDVDTPALLRDYANKLNADEQDWVFLTGSMPYLQRVGAEVYTVAVDKQTHVERFLVFDKWGKQRGQFRWNKPVETTEMKLLLTKLLAETQPPPEEAKQPERRRPDEEDIIDDSGTQDTETQPAKNAEETAAPPPQAPAEEAAGKEQP
jgi:cytochrome oxidase Cu insertion factor (SCO1/SenC/PrrC family)